MLPLTTPSKLGLIHLPSTKLVCAEMLLKKEVIQPQVPLRLPCYDFILVTNHTFGVYLSVKSWINDFGCNQLP